MRLGSDVLVKIKTDGLLEREYLSAPTRDDCHAPGTIVAAVGTRRMAEPITRAFRGEPYGTIPEIEARIHALWTKGEARTREESVELGRLLTALESEMPPGDFYTHVLEVLHISARGAALHGTVSYVPGGGERPGARGVTGGTSRKKRWTSLFRGSGGRRISSRKP